MNNPYGKVNQTNGASNFAYNNNQGNPGTVYNTAPKVGYGSLAKGRPVVAPQPVNGTPPQAGVPVAPRPVMTPPGGRITLDPRERTGFGDPYEGGGLGGMPSQPPMAGYPGLPGLQEPRQPQMWGGLQNGAGWPGMGGQGYWGQQHQQRRDRMAKFRDRFETMNQNRRGDFMPRFGGTY